MGSGRPASRPGERASPARLPPRRRALPGRSTAGVILHCILRRTRTVRSERPRSVHGRLRHSGYRRWPWHDTWASRWLASATRPVADGTKCPHRTSWMQPGTTPYRPRFSRLGSAAHRVVRWRRRCPGRASARRAPGGPHRGVHGGALREPERIGRAPGASGGRRGRKSACGAGKRQVIQSVAPIFGLPKPAFPARFCSR